MADADVPAGFNPLFDEATWRWCVRRWGECAWCGADGEDAVALVVDLVLPLGAPDSPGWVPWNVLPACQRCAAVRREGLPLEVDARRVARARDYLERCYPHLPLPRPRALADF